MNINNNQTLWCIKIIISLAFICTRFVKQTFNLELKIRVCIHTKRNPIFFHQKHILVLYKRSSFSGYIPNDPLCSRSHSQTSVKKMLKFSCVDMKKVLIIDYSRYKSSKKTSEFCVLFFSSNQFQAFSFFPLFFRTKLQYLSK